MLKSHVYFFRWILDICKHERVLQAAKKILGPNIVLLSTCLITKYPTVDEKRENFKGDFVGWHQDLEYCGLVNVEPNEGPKLITMWLAIDKVGTFNNQINSILIQYHNGLQIQYKITLSFLFTLIWFRRNYIFNLYVKMLQTRV